MARRCVLILTSDLSKNQTYVSRYNSFVEALANQGFYVRLFGIQSPYKPHPLSKNDNINESKNFCSVIPTHFNLIQKAILLTDRFNVPYGFKKLLMALHIIVFKTDYLAVRPEDLSNIDFVPDIIVTSGSGGILSAAQNLSTKYNSKLIVDYRDPWNFGYVALGNSNFEKLFKKIFTLSAEIRLLKMADKVLVVSESLKNQFPKHYHTKINVVENGTNFTIYDQKQIVYLPKVFNIVYIGTMHDEQLIDLSFFKAIKKFVTKHRIQANDFKIYFIGSINNPKLFETVNNFGLDSYVLITPRLTQDELRPYLLGASLFLHLKYYNRTEIITSKISDYIFFKKPILLPFSDNGDLENIIRRNNAGYIFKGDPTIITRFFENQYENHKKGVSNILQNNLGYTLIRASIANRLVDIINSI